MAGEEFLRFNNGQKLSFSNFREIKKENLKNADAETKRLFSIFAGDDHVLRADEAQSLWNKLKNAAATNKSGDNSVFDNEEMQNFLDMDADIKTMSANSRFSINALTNIVSQIFVAKESPTNVPAQKATAEQVAKACQENVIQIIDDNISEAEEIFQSQCLGSISEAYDDNKDDNDRLKTSNVRKVLDYQKAGEIQMIEAKNGKLTRRAYYQENKQRIKDMILTRLTVLESSTSVNFLDQYKGKYTKEQLEQIISDYVDTICNNVEMDKLKEMQKQFVSFSVIEEVSALDNFVNNAIDYSKNHSEIKLDTLGGEGKPITIKNPKGMIPSYWDSAEPITFEEVYKTERGVEYSQYKVEQYVLAKKKMETVANAFNRKQQFTDAAKAIVDNKELSVDEKLQQIMTLYSEFYALCDDDGLGELQKIIDSSNTLIKLNENGLDLSAYQNNEQMKQSALNQLLKIAISQKEADFEKFLGGKTIEEYQVAMENAAKDILGEDNAKMLSEAMKNDNMTVIQRYTGNASMAGMGMTVVGGILCFTPLAPLGGVFVTVGNTLAIGGMVAKTGLGVADYATKDVQTTEELTDLAKDFVMDAGGFIVGMGAGKAGMKAFSKLIDKKLTAVFAKEITAGNRMQALKTVLTNPEYLKNFMTAAGAKISTDFMISYVGDLAMMGLLDTDDDWQSLLQANLTGILVGMSGDVKDAAGVGKSARVKPSSGTTSGKPMTQQDYAMSVLGKEVTVKDPVTEAKVVGSVTKVTNENGVVKVEVNGKEYSTDNVVGVKNESILNGILSSDLAGARNTGSQALSDDIISIFRTTKDQNVKIVEYSYKINDMTYKYKASEGLSQQSQKQLCNIDYKKRLMLSLSSDYKELRPNVQFQIAQFAYKNNISANIMTKLITTIGDEQKILKILQDGRLSQIITSSNSIDELQNIFSIKFDDPVKYERIAESGIFDLVKDKKLNGYILRWINKTSDLSSDMYRDLELLKVGKSLVPEFPEGTNLQTAFLQTTLGDAVEVGSKMYINDGTQLIEWNMTKEKYLELFPPVERFATAQGAVSNCHLIQTLGLAMHNPQARVQFLQSFTLKGNDVVVTVKGYENYHGSYTFANSEIKLGNNMKHLIGCKGMQMYEQTYGRVALRASDVTDYPGISPVEDVVERTAWGQAAQTMSDVFGQGNVANDLIEQGFGAYSIVVINPHSVWTTKEDFIKDFDDLFFDDNGNKISIPFNGIDLSYTEALLEHSANRNEFLISFATVPKSDATPESTLLTEYNLVSSHAYSILGYNASTKMVQIGNPYSFAAVTEIPLETLHNYIGEIDFLKL